MKPTQISTIVLMPLTVMHAHYVQNDIAFYLWFLVLVSSVLFHFTKFEVPLKERKHLLVYYFDIGCVCLLNVGIIYDVYIHSSYTGYFAIGWGMYIAAIVTFMMGNHLQILMFDKDEELRDISHAIWHILPNLATHMYLAVYQKRIGIE